MKRPRAFTRSLTGVIVAIALGGAALMPPFFTAGACDAEFDRVASQVTDHQGLLATPELAAAYFWRTFNLPVHILSAQECRRSKPRFVNSCGAGDLLYVTVPVQNTVCRIYRDSAVSIQLQYAEDGRLRDLQSKMKSSKSLHLPGLGIDWHWGR